MFVSEGHEDHAMVHICTHCVGGRYFLTSTCCVGGDERANIFSGERASGPQRAGAVPECLPLYREVAVASGDPEQESVIVFHIIDAYNGIIRPRRSSDQSEDILRQGLGDPKNLSSSDQNSRVYTNW